MNKLIELSVRLLSSSSLFEMAYELKQARQVVISASPSIIEHLALITHLPDHLANNHWRVEVDAWCERINDIRLKTNKKRGMPQDELHQWLVDGPLGDWNDYQLLIKRLNKTKKLGLVPSTSGYDTLMRVLGNIVHDLSKQTYQGVRQYIA